ncbi:MAG: hypothetical protein AUJ01_10815 [Acidobacteria bacterium 13_1_40CM_3_65_5]|nr:MAG: hypothetical protein AUJ01_10815 [Acidobacteria bacterium 13_1_40CM_3_65_5]
MIATGADTRDILDILMKATVMLALGLTAARLARRAQASVRHLLLAAEVGALAVGGAIHRVTRLAERARELLRQQRFIFDDQDPHAIVIAQTELNVG